MTTKTIEVPYPKKTVEEYLAEVSYTALERQKPSAFSLMMVNLIKLIDSGQTENITPPVHYKMLDSFVDNSGMDVINLCHRGFAKTTMIEYLIFSIALFGELPGLGYVPYMLYISDSIDNGIKKMRKALENRYKYSPFLQEHLEEKLTDTRWEYVHKKSGRSLVVSGHGAKTGVRGTRENRSRPVLAILDDVISNEDARSPTEIQKIKDMVNTAIEPALHPQRRKIIWNGTPFNANDPIYTAVESGAWLVNVYPVCEKFPCAREEFKGSWEDRFTYDFILKQYNKMSLQGQEHAFYQEYMLQILSDDTKLIKEADLQWFVSSDILKRISDFNIYISTDFATSEKQHADFSFISVWAVNSNGFKFWIDGICKKQTMDKNIDDLFRLATMYRPQSVGVEVTGQQGGFIPWINKEMGIRNIWFTLASHNNSDAQGIRPTQDKLTRFNTMVPEFKLKRMFFPIDKKDDPALREMLQELRQTTIGGFKSKHDDAIDTISMLSCMMIWNPSSSTSLGYNPHSAIWEADSVEEDFNSMSSYIV